MDIKKLSIPFVVLTTSLILSGENAIANNSHYQNRLPPPSIDRNFHDNGSPAEAKVALGKFLFFDKVLSGNKNISCATCHHGLTDTGDGLSLPVGEGARGTGIIRDTGTGPDAVHERVPRNAPPIFALGAIEIDTLFYDGRVQVDPTQPGGFKTPAGDDLPLILENVMAAQAMFPVTSATEMAGQAGENPIADAVAAGNLAGAGGVWELLADRLRDIPEYVAMFNEAFGITADQITFAHAANAMSAFERVAWRADNSPFDRFLRGNRKAMSKSAKKGMKLFYGVAGCSTCHSGTYQTDMDFHAIAMPQIGPGKEHGADGHEDMGRAAVTGDARQRYQFRTPPLRNVALTGPWGHDGAFDTLEGIVRHHLDPEGSLDSYDCSTEPRLPSRADLDAMDCIVMNDPALVMNIKNANELGKINLGEKKIAYLMDFLHALTDPGSIDIRHNVPVAVPSGLPLAD